MELLYPGVVVVDRGSRYTGVHKRVTFKESYGSHDVPVPTQTSRVRREVRGSWENKK